MKRINFPRATVRLAGADRVSFLQNFCTADIKTMEVGDIREAFILNTKGKLVGHVLVFLHEDFIELNTVPDQAEELIQHLDRYLIREEVELSEVQSHHVFCFGDQEELVGRCKVELNRFQIMDSVRVANCEAAGPGILFSSQEPSQIDEMLSGEKDDVATDLELAFHRVQYGTPWFGSDSNGNTLPQELQRDEKAISFTKGCYLGQETVARIDALGRVNKLLVRLTADQPLQVGEDLVLGEKSVGTVSSSASLDNQYVGLAIVRREAAASGTQLLGATGDVVVV